VLILSLSMLKLAKMKTLPLPHLFRPHFFSSTSLLLLHSTAIMHADKKKKKARIMFQFRSTAGTGQFIADMKNRDSKDPGLRQIIKMDHVVNRPVVWREAKLKSGKAPQFKGYRARERKENQDKREKEERAQREQQKEVEKAKLLARPKKEAVQLQNAQK